MKRTLIFFGYVLLLSVVIVLSLIVIKNNIDKKQNNIEHPLLNTIINNTLFSYGLANDISISGGDFFDTEGKQIPIDSIQSKLPLLIYRYSITTCDLCVNSNLFIINSLEKDILDKILILVSFNNDRERKVYFMNNSFAGSIYEYKDNSGSLADIDQLSYPYFFVLDRDFNLNKIFLPVDGFKGLTTMYINSVINSFNQ